MKVPAAKGEIGVPLTEEQRAKERERSRVYHQLHKERTNARNKAWYQAHRAEALAYQKVYRQNNLDRRRLNTRAYYWFGTATPETRDMANALRALHMQLRKVRNGEEE